MKSLTVLLLICFALYPASSGEFAATLQDGAAEMRAAFLAQGADASAFLALLNFPELLKERRVQMKIFRSLGSRESEIFKAAVALCMKAPQLESVAPIKRRFDLTFVGRDSEKKRTILHLAEDDPNFLQDLRVISLISEALRADPPLREIALSIVQKHRALQKNPAIAEALMAISDPSKPVDVKLPNYQFFKDSIEPIFQSVGADDKDCVHCHKSHPILHLRAAEAGSREELVREHYRSALRVVNLQEPEKSLILLKPTLPAPPEGTVPIPGSRDVHAGDVRWEKGSSSYQTILNWIRTARE